MTDRRSSQAATDLRHRLLRLPDITQLADESPRLVLAFDGAEYDRDLPSLAGSELDLALLRGTRIDAAARRSSELVERGEPAGSPWAPFRPRNSSRLAVWLVTGSLIA